MKKIPIILTMLFLILFSISGCGPEPTGYEGKYVAVAAITPDITLRGDEIPNRLSFELSLGGKGTVTADKEEEHLKWRIDENVLVLEGFGESLTGAVSDDTIIFCDFLGSGIDYIFALEDSIAADPAQYIPDNERAFMKKWNSYAVFDLLDKDISDKSAADGFELILNNDYSGYVMISGTETSSTSWHCYENNGSFDGTMTLPDGSTVDVFFSIDGDVLSAICIVNDEYYIYFCK